MSQVGLVHFLVVGGLLFTLGLVCALTRRNAVSMLIGIELMLNAAGLNFLAFSRFNHRLLEGSVMVVFIIVLAAAEAAVALALILSLQRRLRAVDLNRTDTLKG